MSIVDIDITAVWIVNVEAPVEQSSNRRRSYNGDSTQMLQEQTYLLPVKTQMHVVYEEHT